MSSERLNAEMIESIRHAVEVAKRRLKELNEKPSLTKAESYERDMTIDCIERGNKILNVYVAPIEFIPKAYRPSGR